MAELHSCEQAPKMYKSMSLTHETGNEEKIQQLLHELQTQKLDLEMQNQALQETLAELEESRNRYAALYDFAPVGYVTFDYRGYIREINLTDASIVGMERSQLIGLPMIAIVSKTDLRLFLDHLRRCKETNNQVITELNLAAKGGVTVLSQLHSIPLQCAWEQFPNFRTIITDITERKRVEKEMSRLESLNLLGEMAASLAHEIRNPMTAVRGFLQLMRGKKEYAVQEASFDLMISELDRTNTIISEFLLLAKDKQVQMDYQNLNAIVQAIYPLLNAEALTSGKNISLELGDIDEVLINEKEIRQMILNLAQNGLQAMTSGGKLAIRTLTDGGEVVLGVQDQGSGIPPNLVEKLGTPFLTTKEMGTGLGLSVCYSIADRHNANIRVDTGPAGTTFFVRFKKP